jgi:hypothetical protein
MSRCLPVSYSVVAFLFIAACHASQVVPSSASERSLQGAWRTSEQWEGRPGTAGTTTLATQPSLFVFARRHYSIMYVTAPRRRFAGEAPTDAEKIAAFDSFVGNSGTYELRGGWFIYRPIVARVPNIVGVPDSIAYSIRGDSLWLTNLPLVSSGGLVFRTKLVRQE